MPRAPAPAVFVPVLAAALLAGCAGDDAVPQEGGPAWLPGDRWTYRLDLGGAPLADTWTVLGPGEVDGRAVLDVESVTRGPGVDARDVGSFDAATLALVRVVTADATIAYDPSDVQLLPPADRAASSLQRETRGGTVVETRVGHDVRYAGVESVATDAGTFAAHRFEVRETRHGPSGTAESASTYWWAPAAVNVVRHEAPDGTVYRTLVSYALAEGARTLPDR